MPVELRARDVKAGDVIYRQVKSGGGKHYGICIGNGDVIHLMSEGILWESFDDFASSCKVYGTE